MNGPSALLLAIAGAFAVGGCMDEPQDSCAQLGEKACAEDARCMPLRARRYACPPHDREPFRFVACTPKVTAACAEGEVCARNPSGTRFVFPDGCLPEAWMVGCVQLACR